MIQSHTLSDSLLDIWKNYENRVQLSRKKTSAKNIHQLRILTQKLEAILILVNSLKTNHNSKNIIFLIKKVRKSLGPLRDIQVETAALRRLKEKKLQVNVPRGLAKYILNQKETALKKASHGLDQISLNNERSRIEKLAKKLVILETNRSKKKIQADLDKKIKSSILKLNQMLMHVDPKRPQDIHRFRIQAKKLRYQGEFLNSVSGAPSFNLKHLKAAQSIAGRIQNDRVLISVLDQFLSKKKNIDDPKGLDIRKRIAKHQSKLIKKDFKNLGELKWEN